MTDTTEMGAPAQAEPTSLNWTDVCLHQLIEAQAARTPDAIAVRYGDARLTFRELDQWANRVAVRLHYMGVGPNKVVGVCLDRSLELVVGLLAVLKAGGAYVPLDPSYPSDRLAFILGDANVAALVTTSRLRHTLKLEAEHVHVLEGAPETGTAAVERPEVSVRPEDLAYVIYTSGSTGKPKGALISHDAICNRLLWMQQQYGIGPGHRILQKTPFSFDVSVWELFLPLLSGAELVVARPDGHKDASYLVATVEQFEITAMHFVPSMMHLFLQEPGLEQRCKSLHHVFSSGETLTADLRDRFFARIATAQLHNLYGPTEAAVDVTHYTCARDNAEKTIPIGFPVANTQIYILGDNGQQAEPGEIGEIAIGGVQVGKGYHNRPELTAERFVPDPFGEPGRTLFKTGDLGRYRADGAVEFFGRRDHQIKIRGLRVELGEIEAVLQQHEGVQNAAVVVHESDAGEPMLVAHVVPERQQAHAVWQALGPASREPAPATLSRWQSATELLADVRAHLATQLPDFMVPGSFRLHRELPLTPSGKIDRAALPAPSRSRPDMAQAYVPPRTPLERYITDLWCQILELDKVGIEDRFFELGGDSLRAARFINQMRSRLNEFIYITTIFDAPTIAQFAAMLERDYTAAVARTFGGRGNGRLASEREAARGTLGEAEIERLRSCVPSRPVLEPGAGHQKNPPAIFILAPPRTGTTLLRVMLAGHPQIFAAPELQLLGFETLQDRLEAYQGPHALWLEGGLRAIKEVHGCSVEEAKRIMGDLEGQGLTTRELFKYLQDAVRPRMLVDKSPSYALDPNALARAERDFDGPLYIHLVRHPYAMITSFENYHMDQVLYLGSHDFTARQLGELVWLNSHMNILDFLAHIPQRRHYTIKYEELVTRPRLVMQEMCNRFGIPFDAALLRPYDDLDKKMIDGLQPDSTPMGDTHLHHYRSISPRAAARWRGVLEDDFLSAATWELAELFGYERPQSAENEGAAVLTSKMGA